MNLSLLYQAYGVKNYTYAGIEYKDNSIYLHLKGHAQRMGKCPCCGGSRVGKHGIMHRVVHNLPFGSKRCFLSLSVQRYRCSDCGKTWQDNIPFIRGETRHTYRFSRYVLDLLRMGGTIKSVSAHLGVSWSWVKDIHKRYLKGKYSRPDLRGLRHIGIDEFAVRKGHVYKTIVVDLDTGRIVHVGDGKGKEALAAFWRRIKRLGVHISVVTSDLSAAFIASVMENAPEATHVYDKFHVVKLVTEAVDTVRRNTYRDETDLEKRKILKGSRWLLLTREKDQFDDDRKKRLQNILETNEPLFKAYYLYEDLSQIWEQKNKDEGNEQLLYWCKRAQESGLRPFMKVAETLLTRRTGILAWYDARTSNAKVEGINNKIKVLKRRAYGYRDDEYFKLLLLGLYDETNRLS